MAVLDDGDRKSGTGNACRSDAIAVDATSGDWAYNPPTTSPPADLKTVFLSPTQPRLHDARGRVYYHSRCCCTSEQLATRLHVRAPKSQPCGRLGSAATRLFDTASRFSNFCDRMCRYEFLGRIVLLCHPTYKLPPQHRPHANSVPQPPKLVAQPRCYMKSCCPCPVTVHRSGNR